VFLFLLSGLLSPPPAAAQAAEPASPSDRAKLVAAARGIMQAQNYCALITIGEKGQPEARTMNPFPPEEDLTVWTPSPGGRPRSTWRRRTRRGNRQARRLDGTHGGVVS
jgi:hypothetical protein